ncbi:MAG TPA: type II secretion system protein [Candidatus Paceibacterota bacterium]|nr:type II secretion system protein [Candidatus Paceibacterota bacterium]
MLNKGINYNSKVSTSVREKSGFSLIEVVVAASIITISVLSIMAVYGTFIKNNFDNTASIQAAYLAEEGIEAAKSMRDFGWASNIATLTNGTTYRFYYNTSLNKWQATTTVSRIDNVFDRTFTVGTAYRDGSDNLATSGTADSNTKLVTVNVAWNKRGATSTKTLQTYITNLFDN